MLPPRWSAPLLVAVLAAVVGVRAWAPVRDAAAHAPRTDEVSALLGRYTALAAHLPRDGPVGYQNEAFLGQAGAAPDVSRIGRRAILAQLALAPRVLRLRIEPGFLVLDLPDAAHARRVAAEHRFTIRHDLGDGLLVVEVPARVPR